MSAVLARASQWLEPSGLGHELLTEWCVWARDDREGAHSWSVRPRVDKGFHGTPPDRVMRTDKIVARIRLEYQRYYDVIAHIYLGEKSYAQTEAALRMTPGWLRTCLVAACGLVEMRYRDSV